MKESNRERKTEIKYNIVLNEEQKECKRLILENQIVIVTGQAGSGKSLVCAQTVLDLFNKKQIEEIFVTRAAIEVGKTLGFLPGNLNEKFDPYLEAFIENLYKCSEKVKIENIVKDGKIKALPVQFIRGKTVDDVLVVEEVQNMTKHEVLAIITRLGKTGKIIFNGDNQQKDINIEQNGLDYLISLSKVISEIKWIKLKENHRSDLVARILDFEYKK